MSSVELENKQVIHETILPRLKYLEDEQKVIIAQMGIVTNQMKGLELSNNDVKQTVVGYGQTHSMLLTKAMESMVSINTQNAQIVREVQTTKDKVVGELQQNQAQYDSEVKIAKLGTKEKFLVAVVGIVATPGFFAFVIDVVKKMGG